MSIASNIASIHERITAAAQRAGRNPEDITLMAVSKTQPPEKIREAYKAGLKIFGENRVQEFAGKFDSLRNLQAAEWHMIGHLQTNKAAKTAELFRAVDSVDSVRLAVAESFPIEIATRSGSSVGAGLCSGMLERWLAATAKNELSSG